MSANNYRVYLRWPGQRVSDKTVTPDRAAARVAALNLVPRIAQGAAVVVSVSGRQQAYIIRQEGAVDTVESVLGQS